MSIATVPIGPTEPFVQTKTCDLCGKQAPSTAVYCANCGQRITSGSSATPVASTLHPVPKTKETESKTNSVPPSTSPTPAPTLAFEVDTSPPIQVQPTLPHKAEVETVKSMPATPVPAPENVVILASRTIDPEIAPTIESSAFPSDAITNQPPAPPTSRGIPTAAMAPQAGMFVEITPPGPEDIAPNKRIEIPAMPPSAMKPESKTFIPAPEPPRTAAVVSPVFAPAQSAPQAIVNKPMQPPARAGEAQAAPQVPLPIEPLHRAIFAAHSRMSLTARLVLYAGIIGMLSCFLPIAMLTVSPLVVTQIAIDDHFGQYAFMSYLVCAVTITSLHANPRRSWSLRGKLAWTMLLSAATNFVASLFLLISSIRGTSIAPGVIPANSEPDWRFGGFFNLAVSAILVGAALYKSRHDRLFD